jgi:glycosyltransferase involved in cell wall biosynthesis
MVRLARDARRREELSSMGLQRAHAFSWQRAARETLKVYRLAVTGEVAAAAPVPAAYRSSTS